MSANRFGLRRSCRRFHTVSREAKASVNTTLRTCPHRQPPTSVFSVLNSSLLMQSRKVQDSMRIIAGKYRSRILKSLKGNALRPTSDRLRETLFNVLGPNVSGSHFLDVFAGTGAVGIEALSRGALEAVFIENHAPAAVLIRRNLESLAITNGAHVLPLDALRALEKLAARHKPTDSPFDFVFVDPPYAERDQYARILGFLGSAPFLSQGSLVIAEHRRTFELPQRFGRLLQSRILRQGDASLSFFEHQAAEPDEIPEAA
jgi:16S rRNA (guanine966-N2)-methyltransferase